MNFIIPDPGVTDIEQILPGSFVMSKSSYVFECVRENPDHLKNAFEFGTPEKPLFALVVATFKKISLADRKFELYTLLINGRIGYSWSYYWNRA